MNVAYQLVTRSVFGKMQHVYMKVIACKQKQRQMLMTIYKSKISDCNLSNAFTLHVYYQKETHETTGNFLPH